MFRKILVSFASALMLGALPSSAQTNCTTPAGAAGLGGPVSVQATFTPGDGFITVTVANTLADPGNVGQLLSGLAFTLSEGENSGTLMLNSAGIRAIARGGSFADFGTGSTGWALASNFNGGLLLCVLCVDLGAAGPSHLLIGPPAGSSYASARGSIAGNRPHNPFTAGTATFFINVPGVSANTTVTNAVFSFGTSGGIEVPGACTSSGGGGEPE